MGARGLAIECPAFYMGRRLDTIASRTVRAAAVCAAALALSIVMTWPLASGFGRLGRTTTMDGLYSIWNISWVAHATISHPAGLLDANIFYPHRHALTFSEANILGGVVASPVWWLTGNPYAAHNAALMFAFCSTLIGTWLLVRRLSRNSWRGSGVGDPVCILSVLLLAQCPHSVAHGRRHSPRHAGAPSPRRQSLPGTWRGARTGTRGAGTRLRVLRHLCRSDGRLRRSVPGRIEASLGSQAVLGRARDRGRHLDRGRAPVLSAVRDHATRRRLPAFACRRRPLLRAAGELPRVARTRASMAHPDRTAVGMAC